MIEYALLTRDPDFLKFAEFIQAHNLSHEIHLNRTRVRLVENSSLHLEFLLRFPSAFPITTFTDML